MKKPNYLKEIPWQDLRYLTLSQKIYNIILPYPFLLTSWYCVCHNNWILAVIFSYFFVIAAYRQGHDLYHRSLGVGDNVSTALLLLISLLSFSSLHSMKYSHIEHHHNPLGKDDEEGYLALGTWYQAMIGGLEFRYRIFKHGYRLTPKHHRIKIIDTIDRTQRNPIINALTFNLFYHVEHHLFPAVPTHHLPKLAQRLDNYAPQLTKNRVISLSWLPKQDNDCPIKGLFA